MSGFKRIYYDPKTNKIYHWGYDDIGKGFKEELHPEIEYYIKDSTGKSNITDIYGTPVVLQKSDNIFSMRNVASMMETYETDINRDTLYLQKFYSNKKVKAELNQFQIATIDIEVESSNEFPDEADAKFPINLISVHFSKDNKLYTFGNREYTGNSDDVKNYYYCPDEKKLIENFIKLCRSKHVDIFTGWYSRMFDIPYIINRCIILKIELSLSPINIYKKKHWQGYHIDESDGYEIAGVSILDGADIFKQYEKDKRISYSLQSIGMEVVNEGKKDLQGSVNNAWKKDWNGFVEYNVQDVMLVLKIEKVKKYIELTIILCYQALIPFNRIFSTIAAVEGYIIRYLHENNLVLEDRKKNQIIKEIPGAYCYAVPGYYKYCISYDAESLYPTQIISQNISPETLILNGLYELKINKIIKIVKGDDNIKIKRNNEILNISIKDLQNDDEIIEILKKEIL